MADDTRGIPTPVTGSTAATGRHEAQPLAAPTAPANLAHAHPDHADQAWAGQTPAGQAPAGQSPANLAQADRAHADQVHDGRVHDGRADLTPGDRRTTTPVAAAPVAHDTTRGHDVVRDRDARDRDGDGRDDRTGAVLPGSAKEMAAAQRARYGGLHMGSAFFGWMSAVGIAVILLAILSAAGLAFGLYSTLGTAQEAADQADTGIGLGAAVALLVVLFVAYLAGGYVAGRMARFNGTKQGLGVWLWGVIVTVLAALAGLVLGSQYNVFDQLNLPALPVESGTATTAGLIALGAVLLVTLLGAMLGGKLGSHYHRKVDRAAFEPVEV